MDELLEEARGLIDRADSGDRITIGECDALLCRIPGFTDKHTIEDTREALKLSSLIPRKSQMTGANSRNTLLCMLIK